MRKKNRLPNEEQQQINRSKAAARFHVIQFKASQSDFENITRNRAYVVSVSKKSPEKRFFMNKGVFTLQWNDLNAHCKDGHLREIADVVKGHEVAVLQEQIQTMPVNTENSENEIQVLKDEIVNIRAKTIFDADFRAEIVKLIEDESFGVPNREVVIEVYADFKKEKKREIVAIRPQFWTIGSDINKKSKPLRFVVKIDAVLYTRTEIILNSKK